MLFTFLIAVIQAQAGTEVDGPAALVVIKERLITSYRPHAQDRPGWPAPDQAREAPR